MTATLAPPSRPGESQRLLEEQLVSQICQLDHDGQPRTLLAALEAGLSPDHFAQERLAELFNALCQQLDESDTIDPFTAIMELHDSAAIEEAEVATLADITRREISTLTIKENVAKLRTTAAKRKAAHHNRRAGLYFDEGDTSRAAQEMQLAQDALEGVGTADPIFHKLQSRKFDPENLTEPSEPILTIKGRPIISRGNLLTLKAPDKAGKSHLLGAMARAITEGGKHLGFESSGGGKVVYIDCEQERDDFEHLIIHQAGGGRNVSAYHLTGFTPADTLASLRSILRHEKDVTMVLIDGYADLINDVNDAKETNPVIAELMACAEKYQIGIGGVIHLNPTSDDKSRGHLGSQLGRKSQTTLKIKVDGDTRILFTPPGGARKRPLPESEGVRFEWSEGAHGFVEIEGTPGEVKQGIKAQEDLHTVLEMAAGDAFISWRHKDFLHSFVALTGQSEATAKRLLKRGQNSMTLSYNSATGFYSLGVNARRAMQQASNAYEQREKAQ